MEVFKNTVESVGYGYDIASPAVKTPVASRYPDGGSTYLSYASYLSARCDLLDHLSLQGGLRYTVVDLHSEFADKSFYDFPYDEINITNGAVSSSLGLNYADDKKWKASLLFSSGFRAPNIDDVGKVFDSEPGNVVVPNENLKPEFSYNFELAIARTFSDKVKLEAVGYYSVLRQAMVRRDYWYNGESTLWYDGTESNVQSLVNVGEAKIYGYSLKASVKLNQNFSLVTTLSNNDGEDTSENVPLRHTTPMFGMTSVLYELEKVKVELFAKYNGSRHISDFAPSELNKAYLYTEDGSPSWITINFRSAFELNDKLSINAALENIFDRHYRPYSSGISAPGRNVILSLRAKI